MHTQAGKRGVLFATAGRISSELNALGVKGLEIVDIFPYHSEDDPIVPFVDLGKYTKELPNASEREIKDRGHFTASASIMGDKSHDK